MNHIALETINSCALRFIVVPVLFTDERNVNMTIDIPSLLLNCTTILFLKRALQEFHIGERGIEADGMLLNIGKQCSHIAYRPSVSGLQPFVSSLFMLWLG